MNAALHLLLTRRSVPVRLLAPPAPSHQEIVTLLTIASRVPDHARVVPWRFIVITPEGAARAGELIAAAYRTQHPDATPATVDAERGLLLRAPLVIGVVSSPREHPKAPEWEQLLSCGAACMNLVTAANAMGYSANWHTEWYAYDRTILTALGVSEQERIAGFIHIGTPGELPPDRPRPNLSDIAIEYGADGLAPFVAP